MVKLLSITIVVFFSVNSPTFDLTDQYHFKYPTWLPAIGQLPDSNYLMLNQHIKDPHNGKYSYDFMTKNIQFWNFGLRFSFNKTPTNSILRNRLNGYDITFLNDDSLLDMYAFNHAQSLMAHGDSIIDTNSFDINRLGYIDDSIKTPKKHSNLIVSITYKNLFELDLSYESQSYKILSHENDGIIYFLDTNKQYLDGPDYEKHYHWIRTSTRGFDQINLNILLLSLGNFQPFVSISNYNSWVAYISELYVYHPLKYRAEINSHGELYHIGLIYEKPIFIIDHLAFNLSYNTNKTHTFIPSFKKTTNTNYFGDTTTAIYRTYPDPVKINDSYFGAQFKAGKTLQFENKYLNKLYGIAEFGTYRSSRSDSVMVLLDMFLRVDFLKWFYVKKELIRTNEHYNNYCDLNSTLPSLWGLGNFINNATYFGADFSVSNNLSIGFSGKFDNNGKLAYKYFTTKALF